jgi:hypothetical protein
MRAGNVSFEFDKMGAELTNSLFFGLFLSVTESSITATALVSIGAYFDNHSKARPFELCSCSANSFQATWVVLSYLLAYMGEFRLKISIRFTHIAEQVSRSSLHDALTVSVGVVPSSWHGSSLELSLWHLVWRRLLIN